MKLKDIYEALNQISPFNLQEEWDNSGLQIGNFDNNINEIIISLEATSEIIDNMPNNSLLITHHPLIFKSIKKLDFQLYPSSCIQKAIKKNISIIALHTNFDKTHLNRFVLSDILGFKEFVENGLIIDFKINMDFDEFLKLVSDKIEVKELNYLKQNEFIKSGSIVVGSGGSLIYNIKSDLYLTGDIKYHEFIYAKEMKISLIDITHFESEKYFVICMKNCLENLGYCCKIHNFKNPIARYRRD